MLKSIFRCAHSLVIFNSAYSCLKYYIIFRGTMVFQNIALTKNEKLTTINEKQFLTSLVNNMTARLFTTQSSHVSSKTDATSDVSTLQYEQLVKQFGVLDEETWPTEITYHQDLVKMKSCRYERDFTCHILICLLSTDIVTIWIMVAEKFQLIYNL